MATVVNNLNNVYTKFSVMLQPSCLSKIPIIDFFVYSQIFSVKLKPIMKKTSTLLLLTFLSSTILFAHEFWLMPTKFRVKINESVHLTFYVGENFMGELWKRKKDKTLKLTHFTNQKQIDLTDVSVKSDTNDISLNFKNEGTHVLALETKNSFITLEAQKFNEYLKDDGIDNIYKLRDRKGELYKSSKEFYRRCAKTLIQVGTKSDDTYKQNTGMPLEIIPQQNPYVSKVGDKITVKVLFNGEPLANKMVVTWNKTATVKTRQQKLRTDRNGHMTFILDRKGQWMVSTVHMIPIENNPEADYQSFWGNLTFEF